MIPNKKIDWELAKMLNYQNMGFIVIYKTIFYIVSLFIIFKACLLSFANAF